MSDRRIKKGHPKRPAIDKPRPQFCPCCREPLEAVTRTFTKPRYPLGAWLSMPLVMPYGVKATPPEPEIFDERTLACWVCEKCGVRVVLHTWPPRETWCDREFNAAKGKMKR